MELQELKSELKQLAQETNLTKEQRERVCEIARELGVTLDLKRNCKNCYNDAVVLLYREVQSKLAQGGATDDERRYILRPDVDVFFGGVRVNAATLTDELAERLIARGLERKLFIKCA